MPRPGDRVRCHRAQPPHGPLRCSPGRPSGSMPGSWPAPLSADPAVAGAIPRRAAELVPPVGCRVAVRALRSVVGRPGQVLFHWSDEECRGASVSAVGWSEPDSQQGLWLRLLARGPLRSRSTLASRGSRGYFAPGCGPALTALPGGGPRAAGSAKLEPWHSEPAPAAGPGRNSVCHLPAWQPECGGTVRPGPGMTSDAGSGRRRQAVPAWPRPAPPGRRPRRGRRGGESDTGPAPWHRDRASAQAGSHGHTSHVVRSRWHPSEP